MNVDINHITITGLVERDPIVFQGTRHAVFPLQVVGEPFPIPCHAFASQSTDLTMALHAGDMVLVIGKLKWASTGSGGRKTWQLTIRVHTVRRLHHPAFAPEVIPPLPDHMRPRVMDPETCPRLSPGQAHKRAVSQHERSHASFPAPGSCD